MLLGIDASRALALAPTGTEYYSRALIGALLEFASALRFRLYTRAIPSVGLFPPTHNYEIRVLPFPRLWTHIRLSYEMLRHPPDALFVPAHVIPLIHPPRVLVTVHDLGYVYFPQAHSLRERWYLALSTRWNVRAAQIVVADSKCTRDDLMALYGVSAEKIRVVYPGYNAEVFKPVTDESAIARVRAKYGLGEEYLISVGTLQPRKNYARLIKAVASLPQRVQLVIVGKKGWCFERLFDCVQAVGMKEEVKFLEYVPLADLPLLYAGARLAVFPSLYEGFGFPVLEAQACGTPVLCANASSLPEVAGEGADYFDPLDVTAIRRAIQRLWQDEARRRALSEQGQANVKRFSWLRAAQQIVEMVCAL